MLTDTHCHIHDARFAGDRAETLARARQAGVSTLVTVGCDITTTEQAKVLAQVHPDVFFSSGIHPHEAATLSLKDLEQIKALALHPKCVAIGECGLDYYYNHAPRDMQVALFTAQIQLACQLNKTLILHIREAWAECISILDAYKPHVPVIVHCFTGTRAHAQEFLKLGCFLSIPGIATFKEPGELLEVIKEVPLEHLLIETDAPYLAPIPFRGKRNEPAYVRHVAEKIAQIKQLSVQEIALATTQNAKKAFALF